MNKSIEEFSALTDFVHAEFGKIQQLYGLQKMPDKCIKRITNSTLNAFNSFNALNNKKIKFNVKVEWAIFTMPHGFIWKMFHSRLWYHVKKRLEEPQPEEPQEESEEEPVETLVPQVIQPVDIESMTYLSED